MTKTFTDDKTGKKYRVTIYGEMNDGCLSGDGLLAQLEPIKEAEKIHHILEFKYVRPKGKDGLYMQKHLQLTLDQGRAIADFIKAGIEYIQQADESFAVTMFVMNVTDTANQARKLFQAQKDS